MAYREWPKELEEWSRSAVLAECVRTGSGPRYEHIAYLGSIREGAEGDDDAAARFWGSAEYHLRAAKIEGNDLAKVVAVLEKVVPRPGGGTHPWDEDWRWRSYQIHRRGDFEVITYGDPAED
jgi:hypothetical protein